MSTVVVTVYGRLDEGVRRILTTVDRRVEFFVFKDKTLAYIKSSMEYPIVYEDWCKICTLV